MTTFELTIGEYEDRQVLGEYPTEDEALVALGRHALAHGDQALHPHITEQPSAPVWTVTREGDGWDIRRDGIDISSAVGDAVEVLRQVEALAGTPFTWRITDDGWTFTAVPVSQPAPAVEQPVREALAAQVDTAIDAIVAARDALQRLLSASQSDQVAPADRLTTDERTAVTQALASMGDALITLDMRD